MFRRTLIIAFLAALLTTAATAQRHTTIGIKGGMNISKLSVSDITDESSRLGYHFGLFGRVGLTPGISLQPEVLISSKGSELHFDNALFNGGTVLKLQYVDVPLLLVFHLGPFNLHGGVYGSYLVDAKVTNTPDDGGNDFESEIDENNFERLDAGWAAGAGLELGSLSFGARYLQGLCDVGKEKEVFGHPYNFPDGRNSAWQVYVGLKFF
jgi:hypothetical protein